VAYASFNASIIAGSYFDHKFIIARAVELDNVLQDFFANAPSRWGYETVFTGRDSDIIYDGRYHIYYDYYIARIWNAMGVLRILLNVRIRDALLKGFSSKPPVFNQSENAAQFQISTDLLYKLQADILASIPQHLGVVSRSTSLFHPNSSLDNKLYMSNSLLTRFRDNAEDFQSMSMSGGYFIIWPLWFAGMLDIAREPVRQFVIKNFKSIGLNIGI